MTTERRPPGFDLDGFEWKLVLSSLLAGTYSLAWLGLDLPAPAQAAAAPVAAAPVAAAPAAAARATQPMTGAPAQVRAAGPRSAPTTVGPQVADARGSRGAPSRSTRRVRTRSS